MTDFREFTHFRKSIQCKEINKIRNNYNDYQIESTINKFRCINRIRKKKY